jgi:hypothetical protein
MLPAHKGHLNNRAKHYRIVLQAISFLAAETDFVIPRFPAQLAKRFSHAEARLLQKESAKQGAMRCLGPSKHVLVYGSAAAKSLSLLKKSCLVFSLEMASLRTAIGPIWYARPFP